MATPSQPLRLSLATTRRLLRAQHLTRTRPFSSQQQPLRPQTITPSPLSITLTNNVSSLRQMHTTPPSPRQHKPVAHNREPVPDTPPPTDFGELDVLANVAVPSTAVEICYGDGFALNSGVRVEGGDGVLLVSGEAFVWKPWGKDKRLVNAKGQWDVPGEVWGVLGLVWPKPDLLILGLGPEIRPLSPATRQAISALGIRVEVLDTRNAASQYNLLATERGIGDVAAALIPIGWKEGVGAK